jgi:hypothetical protein
MKKLGPCEEFMDHDLVIQEKDNSTSRVTDNHYFTIQCSIERLAAPNPRALP